MREELKELKNRVEQVKVAGGRIKKETQRRHFRLRKLLRLQVVPKK